jgi:hypothetical protein
MTEMETPAPPRWDGQRLIFELNMEDGTPVRCAISRLALLTISGGGPFKTADLMARFGEARERIEAAAHAKLRERSTPPLGILHIWEDDILDPSPDATPRAMQASIRRG